MSDEITEDMIANNLCHMSVLERFVNEAADDKLIVHRAIFQAISSFEKIAGSKPAEIVLTEEQFVQLSNDCGIPSDTNSGGFLLGDVWINCK